MRDPAFLFFGSATLCAVGGMVWGIAMAMSGDHLLASAHAHLNLVGWVSLAVVGVYYRLTPVANETRLAQLHAGIALLGLGVMVPGIVVVIQGGTPAIAACGAVLSLISMLIFAVTVFRQGFGTGR